MNVFFMDYRYVRKDAWKYIVQVLKIEKVFCFFESMVLPPELFGISNVRYKGSNTSIKTFCNSVVFSIANNITNYTKNNDGTVTYTDQCLYIESKSESPRNNLLKTNDPNALILGIMSDYGEPFFEGADELKSETGLYISKYLCNILRKQLKTSEYSKRICFLMLNFFNRVEYMRKYHIDIYYEDGEKKYDRYYDWVDIPNHNHSSSKRLIRYQRLILKLLHDSFPSEFPLIEKNGKIQYTSILGKESEDYKKAQQKWNDYCDEQKRRAAEEEAEEKLRRDMEVEASDWQREVEEMNRDFWNECGEAGSNCESWPGWG